MCVKLWRLRTYVGMAVMIVWLTLSVGLPIIMVVARLRREITPTDAILWACLPAGSLCIALTVERVYPWMWLLGIQQHYYYFRVLEARKMIDRLKNQGERMNAWASVESKFGFGPSIEYGIPKHSVPRRRSV